LIESWARSLATHADKDLQTAKEVSKVLNWGVIFNHIHKENQI